MGHMAAPAFVEKLNEQLGYEFGAHQQYVAIATYYDALTMPQMAALFYQQALEAPRAGFADVVEPVELALAQEKRVTQQINELTRIARDENDFASDQFMQWFVKEQVEEVAKMSDLLAVVTRSASDYERIEDWVAREDEGESDDPTAPPVAGR